MRNAAAAVAMLAVLAAVPAFAQAPPSFGSGQLDQLMARIALYPDPLLAQILAAATYPNDIPAAAQWADEHHYLTGQALDMMNSDMNWTTPPGSGAKCAAARQAHASRNAPGRAPLGMGSVNRQVAQC
jgi:hypothetical protein